jgi:hypothetical protein
MKRIGVVVTSIALAIAPALAAEKTIPLATMTCKQFVDSPKDTIGVILTWMMGHLQDEDEPAELDFSKMEDLGKARRLLRTESDPRSDAGARQGERRR